MIGAALVAARFGLKLTSLLKEDPNNGTKGPGVVGFAVYWGSRLTASITGHKPASRRDATAEPGGFTAISRWSSEAIPPGHVDAAAPITLVTGRDGFSNVDAMLH
ncbi:MAG: hypothetical protein CVU69_03715 [Deltaproteobacteria bacterium HGW-Deltaproteobacteria-4]|nr:MAG: hypothetical protein CVU69_03715 [Deltaproteobacteria bacterium HGW-Deltaproteobacteria-4]